jgi:hypothetical protein
MRIGGHDLANVFVDVFYDVNLAGPPAMSDMENDLKFNPSSPRLARWRVYQEIAQAFRAARVREVVLLTCRVGNSTEFLRKVANDWGLIVTAYRQRVALLEDVTRFGTHVTRRFLLYLVNNPPPYRTAAETILHEEEIPYAPGDTYRVGPPLP